MNPSGHSILITGGATGIGFAIAEMFSSMNNSILICGRREEKLADAKMKLPNVRTLKCDISSDDGVNSLYEYVVREFSDLNVLVNNAGIQQTVDFSKESEEHPVNVDEININLRGQILLSSRLMPILLRKPDAAIINVTSGLGFVPMARFPIYCATKAAMHSFTMSLRYQLKGTNTRVFELIPPSVYDTELKGKPLEKTDWSISSKEVAEALITGMEKDEYEIAVGSTKRWARSHCNIFHRRVYNKRRCFNHSITSQSG